MTPKTPNINEGDFTPDNNPRYMLPKGYRPNLRHYAVKRAGSYNAGSAFIRGLNASLTAQTPIINGEDPQEYKALRARIFKDIKPVKNTYLFDLANSVVTDAWLELRADRAETAIANQYASALSDEKWQDMYVSPEIERIRKGKDLLQKHRCATMEQINTIMEREARAAREQDSP